MVKLINTVVPPEISAIYAALVSPQKRGATGSTKNRTRRAARKPIKRKKRNIELLSMIDAATALAKKLGINPGSPDGAAWIYDESRRLIVGAFNETYWQPVPRLGNKTIRSDPTSAPDGAPPAYDYRVEDKLPTIPTYPTGSLSTGKAAYSGVLSGGYFRDTFLKWRRLTFSVSQPKAAASEVPLILSWVARIDISASNRASKPMLSLQMIAKHGSAATGFAVSLDAPIAKKTNFYWRFAIPPSVAPYYNSYQIRRITRVLNGRMKSDGTTPDTSLTIAAAPRPMLGRGFNNNTAVDSAVTGDPVVMSFSPCLNEPQMLLTRGIKAGVTWDAMLWNPETGETVPLIKNTGYTSFWVHNCYFVAPSFAAYYPRWNVKGEYCGTSQNNLSDAGVSVMYAATAKGLLGVNCWFDQSGAIVEASGLPDGLNMAISGPDNTFVQGAKNPFGSSKFFARCGEGVDYDFATPSVTFTTACIAGKNAWGIRESGDIWLTQIRNNDGSWINGAAWNSFAGLDPVWNELCDWGSACIFKHASGAWKILQPDGTLTTADQGGTTIISVHGVMCRWPAP